MDDVHCGPGGEDEGHAREEDRQRKEAEDTGPYHHEEDDEETEDDHPLQEVTVTSGVQLFRGGASVHDVLPGLIL